VKVHFGWVSDLMFCAEQNQQQAKLYAEISIGALGSLIFLLCVYRCYDKRRSRQAAIAAYYASKQQGNNQGAGGMPDNSFAMGGVMPMHQAQPQTVIVQNHYVVDPNMLGAPVANTAPRGSVSRSGGGGVATYQMPPAAPAFEHQVSPPPAYGAAPNAHVRM
jgi:hypothetical protein